MDQDNFFFYQVTDKILSIMIPKIRRVPGLQSALLKGVFAL